jgi:hypothetical protein
VAEPENSTSLIPISASGGDGKPLYAPRTFTTYSRKVSLNAIVFFSIFKVVVFQLISSPKFWSSKTCFDLQGYLNKHGKMGPVPNQYTIQVVLWPCTCLIS